MPYSLKVGFGKTLREFCLNTSLSGYKYVVDTERSTLERVLWLINNIIFIIVTIYLVIVLWYSYMDNPTITSLQSLNYPVEKVPFPGVSICNINKISKERALNLSLHISMWLNNTVSQEDALKSIYAFGYMHDFEANDINELINFQNLLDSLYDKDYLKKHPKHIIRELTTPCNEMLSFCKWGGLDIDCSKLFNLRLTSEGYCCTFNYLKPVEDKTVHIKQQESVYYQSNGFENGLTVTVNNRPDDYFFTQLSAIGVSVHIFHAEDYPDASSGSLQHQIIPQGSESFMTIVPTVFKTKSSVITFPIEKRKCYFTDEKHTALGNYTESDCLVDCRIESMMALCNCVPFMIPVTNIEDVCNLVDIPCLNKFKDKWNSLAPSDDVGNELNREVQNSLHCKNRCFPACDSTVYTVQLNHLPLKNKQYENISIIHIYYRKQFVHLYVQDVVYYWFEILSTFGGTFGLMLGLSVISIIEILVYFFYKIIVFSIVER